MQSKHLTLLLFVSGIFIVPFSVFALTSTELAGNSLSEYPYFEYVTAFNEDASVALALDPTLFPAIIGVHP